MEDMQQKLYFIIGGIIIAAIVVASLAYQNLALFGVREVSPPVGAEVSLPEGSETSTGETSNGGAKVSPPVGGETLTEKLPPYQGVPIGIINESEASKKTTPASVREKLAAKLATVSASLAKNPDDLDAWIEVGSVKHAFGDEIGARDAWEYASIIRPQNTTSFFNLGNLYGYYLRDKIKAEKNYQRVLQNDSAYIPGYLTLIAFYREVYQEKYPQEAEKVLLAGLKIIPLDRNIIQSLAFLYKDTDNIAKAIVYFEKYLAIDPENAAIRAELEALR